MTNIVILGAGGRAGKAATAEATTRGHRVTARGRTEADVTDPRAVAEAAAGHDAAIVAVAPSTGDPVAFYRRAADSLVTGLDTAGVTRLVWVGIASLLPDASGVAPLDAEGFPAEFRPFSLGHRAALARFADSRLAWTAVSPAGDFDHGNPARHGHRFTELVDPGTRIGYPDLAGALVDLAERPGQRLGERIGVRRPEVAPTTTDGLNP